jgi:hypothetical protein
MSSFNHRRPLAIEAISSAQLSDRIWVLRDFANSLPNGRANTACSV